MVLKDLVVSHQDQAEILYILDSTAKRQRPFTCNLCCASGFHNWDYSYPGTNTPMTMAPVTTAASVMLEPQFPSPGTPRLFQAPHLAPVPPVRPEQMVFKPKMDTCFDGSLEAVRYFLVAVDQFLRRWGYQFANYEEVIEYNSVHFNGKGTQWNMDLYRMGAEELISLPLFVQAFRVQFGNLALSENARTDLKQLKQGTLSVQDYSKAFHSLAAKLPDWPESLLIDYY